MPDDDLVPLDVCRGFVISAVTSHKKVCQIWRYEHLKNSWGLKPCPIKWLCLP